MATQKATPKPIVAVRPMTDEEKFQSELQIQKFILDRSQKDIRLSVDRVVKTLRDQVEEFETMLNHRDGKGLPLTAEQANRVISGLAILTAHCGIGHLASQAVEEASVCTRIDQMTTGLKLDPALDFVSTGDTFETVMIPVNHGKKLKKGALEPMCVYYGHTGKPTLTKLSGPWATDDDVQKQAMLGAATGSGDTPDGRVLIFYTEAAAQGVTPRLIRRTV